MENPLFRKNSPQRRMEPTTLRQAGQRAQHTTNELFWPPAHSGPLNSGQQTQSVAIVQEFWNKSYDWTGKSDDLNLDHLLSRWTPPRRYAFICWLVACRLRRPSSMLIYLRDGSAQIIARAATLRQKLQIKLSTSPSQSILTPGGPVPALTL